MSVNKRFIFNGMACFTFWSFQGKSMRFKDLRKGRATFPQGFPQLLLEFLTPVVSGRAAGRFVDTLSGPG